MRSASSVILIEESFVPYEGPHFNMQENIHEAASRGASWLRALTPAIPTGPFTYWAGLFPPGSVDHCSMTQGGLKGQ